MNRNQLLASLAGVVVTGAAAALVVGHTPTHEVIKVDAGCVMFENRALDQPRECLSASSDGWKVLEGARAMLAAKRGGNGKVGQVRSVMVFTCQICPSGLGVEATDEFGRESGPLAP